MSDVLTRIQLGHHSATRGIMVAPSQTGPDSGLQSKSKVFHEASINGKFETSDRTGTKK